MKGTRRKLQRHFIGSLAAALLLAFVAGATAARAPEGPWMSRSVHGYRVSLAVETAATARSSPRVRAQESPAAHIVAVRVLDLATGRAADLARASIDVAEQGYAGAGVPLGKAADESGGYYRARVTLATGTTYRILVHVLPAGATRMLEAQFPYRHHH